MMVGTFFKGARVSRVAHHMRVAPGAGGSFGRFSSLFVFLFFLKVPQPPLDPL